MIILSNNIDLYNYIKIIYIFIYFCKKNFMFFFNFTKIVYKYCLLQIYNIIKSVFIDMM